jgi:AhpD family alkylhydroperoxidase
MKNPALIVTEAMKPIMDLWAACAKADLPQRTLELVHLRASQINGCSTCVYNAAVKAKQTGETDERIATTAAWRHAPYFSDAERAALALTEAVTRLEGGDIPDAIWDDAARHYDERSLAALVIAIATVNVWNRLNVTTRQVAGPWKA